MVAGAPRTTSLPPEEMIMLGEELLKWATEETKELRFLFQQFYSIEKGILRDEWKAYIKCPEFRPYYEKTQSILALKCIDGTVKEGFGHRYLKYYDPSLQQHEREEKQFESDLRKKEIESQNEFAKQILQKTTESNNQIVSNVENNQ